MCSSRWEAPHSAGLTAFYRLQARLLWEWRPTRLAIVRRTILSLVVAGLALATAAALLPGLTIDDVPALLLAAALLSGLNWGSHILLEWLLAPLPLVVVQIAGLLLQVLAILALGRIVPGIHVSGFGTAVWAAVLLTVVNGFLSELVAVSDDDSYYSVLVRQLAARNRGRRQEPVPGLLVVQVDGLGLPVLENARHAGRVPVLDQLLRSKEAALHPWIAMLPATTPASQAGILHGRNDPVVGFRWYEKATGRLLVANHPDDAAEIVRRVSDGAGLLAADGASIGNLVTGDAPRSYLTMATIAERAPSADERRLRGFFVGTVNYVRLVVLMLGEIAKELYQAERQRERAIVPRMHRDLRYAIERAFANVALRTVSTGLVIEEMYSGAPVIYVNYTGYDAIAHHTGPERVEAIDALEGTDRAIGSLIKAGRHAPRAYRLVVLSDHGQSLGPSFGQRYGQGLDAAIADLMPGSVRVLGATDPVEHARPGRRIAAEVGRGSRVALIGRRFARGRSRIPRSGPLAGAMPATPPDAIVCASGSLAHVYFTGWPGRMTQGAIEARYPGLIDGVVRHPGVGALLVRTDDGRPQVLGPGGECDLATGRTTGVDPLGAYGSRAGAALARLDRLPNVGDLILLARFDPALGEVTAFEELVGSHGGLGGSQTEPFILCPAGWTLADDPPVGAPALYRQLRRWLAELQTGREARSPGQRASSGPIDRGARGPIQQGR